MERPEILSWLREDDHQRLEVLWQKADATRRAAVGDAVHLRALIEISNHCTRACHYCGLRAPNHSVTRYRMTHDEIMQCVHQAAALGLGTVVLQAGEDPGLTMAWVAHLVRTIRRQTRMAITLSLGERDKSELACWREAGADRYLLRFETSNLSLYETIHPSRAGQRTNRIELLRALQQLGYEVGSGIMVGIPGQSFANLADDVEMFRALELDMIGVGPFIPHPQTPLGSPSALDLRRTIDQVPNTVEMTCKVVAIARVICPETNIPSTTAVASLDPSYGRELALRRGGNVVMPNFTPPRYRAAYTVYPGKARVQEEAETCLLNLTRRICAISRSIGTGRGDSPHRTRRRKSAAPATARSHT